MNAEMQPTQVKESKRWQLPVTGMAYAAAVLFTIHLITYFIPSIRDATPTSSIIVAELLALLGVAEHLLLFPVVGWLLALDLAMYSFIAFIPFTFVVLIPSLVLLPVWLVLVGRLLAREGGHWQGRAEVGGKQGMTSSGNAP
jgi:hypothetical protein